MYISIENLSVGERPAIRGIIYLDEREISII